MEVNPCAMSDNMSKAMGDKDKGKNFENASKDSLNALHTAKPSQNISVKQLIPESSEESLEKLHETISFDKIESVFEVKSEESNQVESNSEQKLEQVLETTSSSSAHKETDRYPETYKECPQHEPPGTVNLDRKPRLSSAASGLNQGDRIIRNQSDIFALNEQISIGSSIFSINGSPLRKLYTQKELSPNNVFPKSDDSRDQYPPSENVASKETVTDHIPNSYNDLKRPSSSIRNPLTGTGVSSNDEYKYKTTQRKDGNPLLGLGYSPEATPSAHRIPPGGFSHKLC